MLFPYNRRVSIVSVFLIGIASSACSASSPPPTEVPAPRPQRVQLPVRKVHLLENATSDVVEVPCDSEARSLGATCGRVPVPLDRANPARETIDITFELYPHTQPGPAESALLVNQVGRDGESSTAFRALWLSLYAPSLDVRDLVVIDDRGLGALDTDAVRSALGYAAVDYYGPPYGDVAR
jgi:hypothetical protein